MEHTKNGVCRKNWFFISCQLWVTRSRNLTSNARTTQCAMKLFKTSKGNSTCKSIVIVLPTNAMHCVPPTSQNMTTRWRRNGRGGHIMGEPSVESVEKGCNQTQPVKLQCNLQSARLSKGMVTRVGPKSIKEALLQPWFSVV